MTLFTLALLLAAQPDTATISGVILDSVTKQPVPAAKVVLMRQGQRGLFSDSLIANAELKSDDPAARLLAVLTNPQGQFRFTVSAPGSFMLYVKCEGYANGQLSVPSGPGRSSLTVFIEKEGAISGRVTDTDTRRPVPGLAVRAMKWTSGNGARFLSISGARTTTDLQGRYALTALAPGEYVIVVQAPVRQAFFDGGSTDQFRALDLRGYPPTYYPGVDRREQSLPVTLLPGALLDSTNIALRRQRLASIRGTVLAPASDIELDLEHIETSGLAQSFSIIAHAPWRAGKPFRLDHLPPGHYALTATRPADGAGAILQFDLDDRNLDGLDLTLSQGVTLSGIIRQHESLPPLAEQPNLRLRPLGRSFRQWDLAPATTDAAGRFTRPNLMPGRYRVELHPLPRATAIGEVRYNGKPVPRAEFDINPGALDHSLEIVLWPATASIQVSARRGLHPAAGAQFIALRQPIDPSDPQNGAITEQADNEGKAIFTRLLAGTYLLLAVAPDVPWRTDGQLAQRLTSARKLELETGSAQSVELEVQQ